MNWEENRELGVVRLHIFNLRISNSRKIHGPKKRELGGHTVLRCLKKPCLMTRVLFFFNQTNSECERERERDENATISLVQQITP